ncbi:MAG: DNA topoisomerase (ATP-hydrolyzing) subunit B [Bacteroidetes bacterium]|nr:DNA topoisomerase (ATP-hydrolyzing) subunit B [Bacteroidota bacterium]MCL5033598.1 DNA topoisomerase (ATP-hydrolyzing) subunit B [Bacteroidota bacterium]
MAKKDVATKSGPRKMQKDGKSGNKGAENKETKKVLAVVTEEKKQSKSDNGKGYTAESITILKGLEAVRKRPAMYIGDVGQRGLHHLVYEIVDNSIDEALAGFCKNILVTINKDGSITVEDDGRGIPTDLHPVEKKSALEVVMTMLHAGGKFDKTTYKVSGGLHGVGAAVVNAVSEWAEVTVYRDGKVFYQKYKRGEPVEAAKAIGKEAKKTGTTTTFMPDKEIFKNRNYKFETLAERMRELAFLNPEITIKLMDKRDGNEEEFHYNGGIVEFVRYIDGTRKTLAKDPIFVTGEREGVAVEVAFEYCDDYRENLFSYVNDINTVEGGTHVSGFRSALTRTLKSYADKNNLVKSDKINLTGDDFREGLTVVISAKVPEPQFEGQTKTKLGNGEVESIVQTIVNDRLGQYLEENPGIAKRIIDRAVNSAEAREAARKAREIVRRKNALESSNLPGKLADCSINDPEHCEIFIVEGDSAGGSAKQGRDRQFQAILPLKGKILNVEKARMNKILENDEIRSIVQAIGAGIGDGDEFSAEKARYGKVILMADADVDGSHIRTLLLTFFFRYMKELVELGKVYIAQPPLYKVKRGKAEQYAYSEDERDDLIKEYKKGTDAEVLVSRFKGLGEMNPEQLWETTMDPNKRTLLQVSIENAAEADRTFSILMGEDVEPRKNFIEKNAKYVRNLDV